MIATVAIVIVYKMDAGEIEDIYKKDLEEAKKLFLDGIEAKKDLKQLEAVYKNNLKTAREKYSELMARNIGERKKLDSQPKKAAQKKEEPKRFELRTGGYDLNFFQKARYKFGLKFFKFWFGLRNSIKSNVPAFVSYRYIKFKFRIRKFISWLGVKFDDFKESIKTFSIKSWAWLKNLLKKVSGLQKKIYDKIIAIVTRQKPSGEGKTGESEVKKLVEGEKKEETGKSVEEGQ